MFPSISCCKIISSLNSFARQQWEIFREFWLLVFGCSLLAGAEKAAVTGAIRTEAILLPLVIFCILMTLLNLIYCLQADRQ